MENIDASRKLKFNTKLLLVFNAIMGIGKILLSILFGLYMLISGIFSICMLIAKLMTYNNIKKNNDDSLLISLFVITAGIAYSIYMARLFIIHYDFKLNLIVGIIIALIGFIDISLSIIGIVRYKNKLIRYRYIKFINLASSISAIMLTMYALTNTQNIEDIYKVNAICGIIAGLLIALVGLYIYLIPKVTISQKLHNVYKVNGELKDKNIKIVLYESKIYSSIYYEAKVEDNIIDGMIKRGKSPLFSYNIFIIILLITLSEILVFPYAIKAFINHLNSNKLIKKLDDKMKDLNCIKIKED